jgi:hypothetical protein
MAGKPEVYYSKVDLFIFAINYMDVVYILWQK